MDKISVLGDRFVDGYGRERIFNGINFGSKNMTLSELKGGYFKNDFNDDLVYLKKHGFNLIRYFVNWSMLEPQPGMYNETELAEIAYILDLCEKNEIYVILDMHQDLYSAYDFIGDDDQFHGDGAPKWACLTNGHKYHKAKLVWAEGYFFSKAVQHCFDNFWNNTDINGKGIQDRFCELWQLLAKRFGNHSALLGFDLFNEPYPGSDGALIFNNIVKSVVKTTANDDRINKRNLALSLTKKQPVFEILSQFTGDIMNTITDDCRDILKKFDETKYMPFVNRVATAIRQVNESAIIFFEHTYFSNLGIPFSGSPVCVNGNRECNQAFSPHGYDFLVDTKLYKYADNSRIEAIFNQRRDEQLTSLNIPVLVGEWGGGAAFNDWFDHADYILNMFDSFKWSHCYWCFDEKIINSQIIDVLCRAHPVSVNGSIAEYSFDRSKQQFTLSFNQDNDSPHPTVIFCHKKPAQINTDCDYEIDSVGKNTYMLNLYANAGEHKLSVLF